MNSATPLSTLRITVQRRELLREAWRNTASGTSRPITLMALLALALGIGVGFAGHQQASAVEQYNLYLSGGAATTIVRSSSGIDAARCAMLGEISGIQGAVALREVPGGLTLAAMPSFSQAHFHAVGDVISVLGGQRSATPGVLLSAPMAERLGLTPGDALALTERKTVLAGVFAYPEDRRLPLLSTAIVEPVARAEIAFDQCWVTIWPPREEYRALLDTAVTAAGSQSVEIMQLNSALGIPRSLDTLVERANVRWLQAGAVVLALVIGAVWVRSRRVELALARHLGQSRGAQHAQVLTEAALVACVVALAAVVGTAIALSLRLDSDWLVALTTESTATAVAVLLALTAGILLALTSVHPSRISDWAKDR